MRAGQKQPAIYVVSWYRDGSGMENGPTVRFFGDSQVIEIAKYVAAETEHGKVVDVRHVPMIGGDAL